MGTIPLRAVPLTRAAFARFGDVIDTHGIVSQPVNDGSAQRFHDLARLDLTRNGGRPQVNIFRAQPVQLPLPIRMLERHPLSSQCFVPLDGARFLIVVAAAGVANPAPEDVCVFAGDGSQGVNYAANVWHHPLLALDRVSDFLVIDRGGAGENCEETWFTGDRHVLVEGVTPA